jgi:hypothetical protein
MGSSPEEMEEIFEQLLEELYRISRWREKASI